MLLMVMAPAPAEAQRMPPAVIGAAVGGAGGTVAGLLFAHEACDEDPCGTGAYALAAVGGAGLFAAMGALIGSQAGIQHAVRRNVWTGVAVGGALGAAAGIVLVAASCKDESCGAAGYASVATTGAAVLGGLGAVIGARIGRGRTALQVGNVTALPMVGPHASGIHVGARILY